LTVLLLAVVVGILAQQFGLHPAVGAYMTGLILLEEYFLNDILNAEAFYTLMTTAFWLNIAVPITTTLWKPYYDRALLQKSASKHTPDTGPH
jgi:predicted Kef-type K+ transport protein